MKANKYQNFLRDFIFNLKEEIHTLKLSNSNVLSDFEMGMLAEKENVLSNMKSHLDSFEIAEEEIHFNDFDDFIKNY